MLPQTPLAGFKGKRGKEWERQEEEGKGKGGEEQGGMGRGEEVDSDAQLEQGRRLAKAGPDMDRCVLQIIFID